MRRAVLALPAVELRHGVTVEGLVTAQPATPGEAPTVSGVTLSDGTDLPADLVVAAVGRRSAVPRWLEAIDVTLDETHEDTGIVYLSRFYRLADVVPVDAGIIVKALQLRRRTRS